MYQPIYIQGFFEHYIYLETKTGLAKKLRVTFMTKSANTKQKKLHL